MCKELIENIGQEPQHPKSAMYAAVLSAVPLIGMGVVVFQGTVEAAQTTFWAMLGIQAGIITLFCTMHGQNGDNIVIFEKG
jgi:hypothetical protein